MPVSKYKDAKQENIHAHHRFQVKKGASMIGKDRHGQSVMIAQGTVFSLGDYGTTTKSILDSLHNNFIDLINRPADELNISPTELSDEVPNLESVPTLPGTAPDGDAVDFRKGAIKTEGRTTPPAPVESTQPVVSSSDPLQPTATSTPSTTSQVQSVWVLNPADIVGKDLNQLNAMLAERWPVGQDFEEFTSEQEAVDFLSQDFEANAEALGVQPTVESSNPETSDNNIATS